MRKTPHNRVKRNVDYFSHLTGSEIMTEEIVDDAIRSEEIQFHYWGNKCVAYTVDVCTKDGKTYRAFSHDLEEAFDSALRKMIRYRYWTELTGNWSKGPNVAVVEPV